MSVVVESVAALSWVSVKLRTFTLSSMTISQRMFILLWRQDEPSLVQWLVTLPTTLEAHVQVLLAEMVFQKDFL